MRMLIEIWKIRGEHTACKFLRAFKLNAGYPRLKKGYDHRGIFSFFNNAKEINLNFYYLCLLSLAIIIPSYQMEVLEMFGANISSRTISNWILKTMYIKAPYELKSAPFLTKIYTRKFGVVRWFLHIPSVYSMSQFNISWIKGVCLE